LILNPGRVGLVAVDSLMLQLPIVTMSNSLHAPEYEYIRDNGSSIAVDGNIPEYASKVIELLQNPKLIQAMREVCSRERDLYTVEKMVENFTSGLTCILSEGSDRV
jgi:glycosyltransferase involved in cell wall biosynthesis